MKFSNTYINLPNHFYAQSRPAQFLSPVLIALNQELAQELSFDFLNYSTEDLAQIFSGQKILDGSHFISLAYAGHQFGHFVPSLGDGRAILLGEVLGKSQRRYDVQLKGPGATPFSRKGDGRSALGPVIREYIVSEAMHRLGVPTTRALAAVLTGELVHREESVPGGVFTRVASSHMRIGTFEYFASRGDVEGLKTLLDYAINRHYPDKTDALGFFEAVVKNQVSLVSHWMSLGFIHGVMNTDNMSISGETIDYGPCAFMDHFNFNQVYSFIDRNGRYAYLNQPNILVWNLSRLADCLVPLVDEEQKTAIEKLTAVLTQAQSLMKEAFYHRIGKKLGLSPELSLQSVDIISNWLEYLNAEKIDFTLGFRKLSELVSGLKNTTDSFYPETPLYQNFLSKWQKLVSTESASLMDQTNPLYIPRNHQVERAISAALNGDYRVFHEINKLLQNPYVEQEGFSHYTLPPQEEEKIKNTFCGT